MPKILELKGSDINDAYDGYKLSDDFGYSCANFHVNYHDVKTSSMFSRSENMNGNDMRMFDIFRDNTDNISCFVYINDEGKIEGRRMFFKGKQLLDHNVFPINTKLGKDVYYLYGYYGNGESSIYNRMITKKALSTYKGLVTLDDGYINKGRYNKDKEYWIMQIEKMDYDKYPPLDFLRLSPELRAFSNFNPSTKIVDWLVDTYSVSDAEFHAAYRYTPGDDGGFFQHWNQKFYDDGESQENYDDEEVQEEYQEDEVQESSVIKKFNKYNNDKKI